MDQPSLNQPLWRGGENETEGQSAERRQRTARLEAPAQSSQAAQDAEYDEVLALPVFAAGRYVAPGVYHRVGSDFIVLLRVADFLPASMDGKVAHYILTTTVIDDIG